MALQSEEKGDVVNPKTLYELLPKRPPKGSNGKSVSLVVNSFPMSLLVSQISVYDVTFQPEIPPDAKQKRRTILKKFTSKLRDDYGVWFYDTTRIWALRKVEGTKTYTENDSLTVNVRWLKAISLPDVSLEEQEMIVHIILSKCIRSSDLVRVGRNYFEKAQEIEKAHDDSFDVRHIGFPNIRLWRGYAISVEPTVQGLQLKADVCHRVLQQQNVRTLINHIQKDVKVAMQHKGVDQIRKEVKRVISEQLNGAAVLTLYNKRVWRVHEVDWELCIRDSFTSDNGEELTYQEYFFKRYGAVTKSKKKGMLIHRPRNKADDKQIVLAPELCYLTGLTKKMKGNYALMKKMADKTRLEASVRHNLGKALVMRLEATIKEENAKEIPGESEKKVDIKPAANGEAVAGGGGGGGGGGGKRKNRRRRKGRRGHQNQDESKQGPRGGGGLGGTVIPAGKQLEMPLSIDPKEVKLRGRVLEHFTVQMQEGSRVSNVKSLGDLQRKWGKCGFINPRKREIRSWCVVAEVRDRKASRLFIEQIERLAKEQMLWGRVLSDKPFTELVDTRPGGRNKSVETCWRNTLISLITDESKRPDMLVCILPGGNLSSNVYATVKTVCCSEKSVLSQCIQMRNVNNDKRITAICRNLLKQMMTKAGNIPWRINWTIPNRTIRPDTTMVIGVDVNHDWKKNNSAVGFCASYNSDFTMYHSFIRYQDWGVEIVEEIEELIEKSLQSYRDKNNGVLPEDILIYRDGVSNSQLETVVRREVFRIKERLKKIKPGYDPRLSVVVVQKRVSARFLTDDANPRPGVSRSVPPGTVVDNSVVSSRFWDFYLVTCEAPREGTATPTRYIVVWDDLGMTQDDIQTFTNQMCTLYFNWPGPIRVPAPCMYAHKIAYLFGTAMEKKIPNEDLNGRPYYL